MAAIERQQEELKQLSSLILQIASTIGHLNSLLEFNPDRMLRDDISVMVTMLDDHLSRLGGIVIADGPNSGRSQITTPDHVRQKLKVAKGGQEASKLSAPPAAHPAPIKDPSTRKAIKKLDEPEEPRPIAWGLPNNIGKTSQQTEETTAEPEAPTAEETAAVVPVGTEASESDDKKTNTAKKSKRLKRYEPFGPVRPIVQTILNMKRYPKTLEEVLEMSYGAEWRTRLYHKVAGPFRVDDIPFEEEIKDPASQIKAQIRKSLEAVYNLWEKDFVPEGYEVTALMRNYVEMARAKRISFTSLNTHLKKWGI